MNRAFEISVAFLESHPDDAARVLEQLPVDQAAAYLERVAPAAGAAALARMQPGLGVAVLSACTPAVVAELLLAASADTRALLVRGLSDENRNRALATLSGARAARMRRALVPDTATVGAWMDPSLVHIHPDTTVGDCLARLRQLPQAATALICAIDSDRRFIGAVAAEQLIGADPTIPLADILEKGVPTLSHRVSLQRAVAHPGWTRFRALPVTDTNRRLVGIARLDALQRGLRTGEDIATGTSPDPMLTHVMRAFVLTASELLQITARDLEDSKRTTARD